ncbi:uncharacterized protein LOC107359929 [Tetranychus urticae]|uniref:Uncharacterized protein n=1 Tax=Tetranychus urticae TaxID=32264 RepID=T1K1I8_TETUR|nr:uncharacterized protein LOC107359929 [Tetranychus urticae]
MLKLTVRSFSSCKNSSPIYLSRYLQSSNSNRLVIEKTRACSTSSNKPSQQQSNQIPKEFMPEEVIEKVQSVRSLDVTSKVPLRPVQDLGIKSEVLRVQKNGSFIKRLFIGKFDSDFLAYPEILKTRKEYDEIQKQCAMIETHWQSFSNDTASLHKLQFDKLWKMTATEMMTVFESIGHASTIRFRDCFTSNVVNHETEGPKPDAKGYMCVKKDHPVLDMKSVHNLFNLLNHNCLGLGAVEWGDSDEIRDQVLQDLRSNPSLKIGFAWTERELPFGAGSFADWDTVASRSTDKSFWTVSGSKNRILKDNYDYYLIFAKTQDYTEEEKPQWMLAGHSVAPPGIVGFLVPAKMIGRIEDEELINGLVYQKITFDNLVLQTQHHLLVEPSPLGIRSLNIRGLGLLGTSATILGLMKSLLNDCYRYLLKQRTPLLDCQTVERLLCNITNKIYSLESCLYMTSQAYDAFDNINADPEQNLEASVCKILAIEMAHEIIESIQSIYGSQMLITSPLHDFINLLDSYLDNSVAHRVNVGMSGMWFAGYYKNDRIRKRRLAPFFPMYRVYELMNEYKLGKEKPKLIYDLRGHVHPSLGEEADKLETLSLKFGLGVEWVLKRWAKETVRRQNDLERIAEMVVDIYTMTGTLSRASKAYCDACKNCDMDRFIAISIINRLYEKGMLCFEELNHSQLDTDEYRNHHIHRKNIEYGGYFAQSSLHRIHY